MHLIAHWIYIYAIAPCERCNKKSRSSFYVKNTVINKFLLYPYYYGATVCVYELQYFRCRLYDNSKNAKVMYIRSTHVLIEKEMMCDKILSILYKSHNSPIFYVECRRAANWGKSLKYLYSSFVLQSFNSKRYQIIAQKFFIVNFFAIYLLRNIRRLPRIFTNIKDYFP